MVIDTIKYAVPFTAVTWHSPMTGVLPVVGGSLGARALLLYKQFMRDRQSPLWESNKKSAGISARAFDWSLDGHRFLLLDLALPSPIKRGSNQRQWID